jgi:hypothetical protein
MRPERFFIHMLSGKTIPYLVTLSILSFSLLMRCDKEPDDFGRPLIPDSIHVFVDTTERIHSFTIEGDSLVTNKRAIQLFGCRTDPMFGNTISELIAEIFLVDNDSFNFGSNPRADSVIFTLSFTGYAGDPESDIEVFLYEYTEQIEMDTNVYSNKDISGNYNPVVLGSGYVNFVDSVLRINVTNEDFIQKFFDADDTIFTGNEKLIQYIRGLYLHPVTHSAEGAIFYVNFSEDPGRLSFYYYNDDDDSLDYHLAITQYSGRLSIYHHNYQGFPVYDFISGGNESDSLVFIQSAAGVNGMIHLPELESWKDSMPVAINHAKLILKPADTLITGIHSSDYPQLLNMYLVDPSGGYRYVFDYLMNDVTFGGEYNSKTNSYVFNIGYHIQSYLNGDIDNFDFILVPDSPSQIFSQVILCGAEFSGKNRMKIEIIYTPL